jgi:molybdate/tungstate transport system substrate-binding protein
METKKMNKKQIYSIVAVIVAGLAITGLVVGGFLLLGPQKTKLKVFHAGSLTVPFEEVEDEFEKDHPDIDVQLEPAGSVQCVTKITEAGDVADVLAVADWNLIPDMPSEYQDYYIKFAVNQMVLSFDNSSGNIPNMDKTNYYEVLNNTRFGFSNPNLDPCGYRSLMVLQLTEFESGNYDILEDLVLDHSDITNSTDGKGNYTIHTPEELNPDSEHITIRDKSVDLVSMVKDGDLPFAFEYRSVAVQHDLDFIELGQKVDLSNATYDDTYDNVVIDRVEGESTGKSITYGITVPNNANKPDLGAEFIEYVINSTVGDVIFNDNGQPPINPCLTNNLTLLPDNLQPYCIED